MAMAMSIFRRLCVLVCEAEERRMNCVFQMSPKCPNIMVVPLVQPLVASHCWPVSAWSAVPAVSGVSAVSSVPNVCKTFIVHSVQSAPSVKSVPIVPCVCNVCSFCHNVVKILVIETWLCKLVSHLTPRDGFETRGAAESRLLARR